MNDLEILEPNKLLENAPSTENKSKSDLGCEPSSPESGEDFTLKSSEGVHFLQKEKDELSIEKSSIHLLKQTQKKNTEGTASLLETSRNQTVVQKTDNTSQGMVHTHHL